MRSNYGTIHRENGHWRIEAESHVLYRAQRAILNSKRVNQSVIVPATGEAAAELLWFTSMWPLDVPDEMQLRSDSADHYLAEMAAERIIGEKYKPKPVRFRKGLRPRRYQSQAADLLKEVKGLLCADQLGLGKTITAATAIIDTQLRPAAVIVPATLQKQWQDALHKFIPGLKTHRIMKRANYLLPKFRSCPQCNRWIAQQWVNGRVIARQKCEKCSIYLDGAASDADVIITTYHKLDAWADVLGPMCNMVCFDEIHELRNNDNQKWKAAKNLSQQVSYRLGLSATPIFNYGGEVHNVVEILRPGALGSKTDFREQWCLGGNRQGSEPQLQSAEAVGTYLREKHIMIRRTREEVGRELPKHTRIVHPIEADLNEINKIQSDAAALARLIVNRDRQSMNAAGQLESMVRQQTGLAKAPFVAAFAKMLLEQGTPVILFGWHHSVYNVWSTLLRDHDPWMYHGQVSPAKKEEAKARFMCGDTNLLICSLHSGVGMDGLQQRCATGVFGELDWSPARLNQCCGRYFRDGQTRPCMSYFLVCEHGLDPVMSQVLGLKREQSDGLLGKKGDPMDSGVDSTRHIHELAMKYLDGK
jgi:SNF2 family DNA or RNA helicase